MPQARHFLTLTTTQQADTITITLHEKKLKFTVVRYPSQVTQLVSGEAELEHGSVWHVQSTCQVSVEDTTQGHLHGPQLTVRGCKAGA